MQHTLVIFKPSSVERRLVGRVLARFEEKGLHEHYAHLVERPFFPSIMESMTATPVIVLCLKGVEAIQVVRSMTGATNGRQAAPGTIRGDFAMSNQENIIHASSSPEDAEAEIKRFFSPGEIFDYTPVSMRSINEPGELEL